MDDLLEVLEDVQERLAALNTGVRSRRNLWLAHAARHIIEARFALDKSRGIDQSVEQFRTNFANDEDWQQAMDRADELEAQGMRNRAWRVRRNLDDLWPQP